MREKFTDSLEKHLSSIFSEKTSSEQGVLGKHPGTDPTPTFFWGRSQAPDFWATPRLQIFEFWTEKHWKQSKRKVRLLQRTNKDLLLHILLSLQLSL